MTDEKKSEDELIEDSTQFDEDDELLSDFHDLFPEEDENDDDLNEFELGTNEFSSESDVDNDELDELNNILDDFEQKLDNSEGDEDISSIDLMSDNEDDDLNNMEISTDNDDMEGFDIDDLQISTDEDDNAESEKDDLLEETDTSSFETDSTEINSDSDATEIDDADVSEFDIDEIETDEMEGVTESEVVVADDIEDQEETQSPIFDEEISDNEPDEQPQESVTEDNQDISELDQVIAASTSTLDANTISNLGAPKETPFVQNTQSKGSSMMTKIAIVIALVIGGTGAFLAFNASTSLQQAQMEISQLKLSGGNGGATQSDPRIPKLFAAIDQINIRLNEISVMLDGPMSQMKDSDSTTDNEVNAKLQALSNHVAMIDQVLSGLESQQDKLADSLSTSGSESAMAKPAQTVETPLASSKGRWALNLQSLSDMKNAERTIKELKDIGVSAVVRKSENTNKVWYRVRIEGFDTYNEAKAYIKKLPDNPLTANTWVTNN